MLVALIAHDKPDAQDVRAANRADHLAHLGSEPEMIAQAGPLLDADGGMIGSLIIMEVPDMDTAQRWADADPYAKAGLFQSVTLRPWKKVIG